MIYHTANLLRKVSPPLLEQLHIHFSGCYALPEIREDPAREALARDTFLFLPRLPGIPGDRESDRRTRQGAPVALEISFRGANPASRRGSNPRRESA